MKAWSPQIIGIPRFVTMVHSVIWPKSAGLLSLAVKGVRRDVATVTLPSPCPNHEGFRGCLVWARLANVKFMHPLYYINVIKQCRRLRKCLRFEGRGDACASSSWHYPKTEYKRRHDVCFEQSAYPRNYDCRLLPATGGEEFGTFIGEGLSDGEQRLLGVCVFGCGPLMLAFELGVYTCMNDPSPFYARYRESPGRGRLTAVRKYCC